MSRDKFIVDAEDLEWFTAKPPEGQKPGKGAEKSKKPVDAPSAGEAVTQNFDDITVIRLENFNKLLDEFRQQFHDEPERGMFTRFAEKLGISPTFAPWSPTGGLPANTLTMSSEQPLDHQSVVHWTTMGRFA